ncbi:MULTISPECIES: family 1 encapsulin nanocompartment shell protein [unclassified Caballeronia]|uniref:family 1 encapsulin nanocompartment shell protein n=1 Tax=unclassified Caballeronia TaxID=2646786 RepID=UPI00285D2EC2|nr:MULTISPECIES: family 1 encapsulin nanocompartment shell protein [unclassified Caballeronia]MDR5815188.1 family 1 encapsulin nanocompartment shell protein [Caballeronia sp. LZ033]MDR5821657.1 family 1 encapsulin nanocompartment shell protein [Caballeronia sp. LZ043]MDR5879878.1 family 1 encapsulin nanocompartment shell protein [Caballeronia sp. LZ032]
MNNLHRELAPIASAAWSQIEAEVARTFKRSVAGRRVVDVKEAGGSALSAIGTGHQSAIAAPAQGVTAKLHDVRRVVELTVPFTLQRESIDSVERGSNDGDWQPAKTAASDLARAEDSAIFDGYKAAGIVGIREGSSNDATMLPTNVADYPVAISQALEKLRLAGVDGPYSVLLGADAYTALAEASDQGYPVIQHIKRIVSGDLVWAPALQGGCVLSTRGGDYELYLGQDLSIGYTSHTDTTVQLYLRETLTFLMLTSEASVSIATGE